MTQYVNSVSGTRAFHQINPLAAVHKSAGIRRDADDGLAEALSCQDSQEGLWGALEAFPHLNDSHDGSVCEPFAQLADRLRPVRPKIGNDKAFKP